MSTYIFDNAAPQTHQRFDSLELLYDAASVRHLEATGVGAGWNCLEVGAGSGSIARWLAQQVGPTGHVLVTDINPRFLDALAALKLSTVEIQQHDIGTDMLPAETFDLIHARLVLIHVPTRLEALTRMVAALKPGGWIVIEDFDSLLIDRSYPIQDSAHAALYQKMLTALLQLRVARGAEFDWGRRLYGRLVERGLVDVGMEGHHTIHNGNSPGSRQLRTNTHRSRKCASDDRAGSGCRLDASGGPEFCLLFSPHGDSLGAARKLAPVDQLRTAIGFTRGGALRARDPMLPLFPYTTLH